jgi:hypothetical protein
MSRNMAGLLAAVVTAMSALVGLVHGDLVWVVLTSSAVASGFAARLPSLTYKKYCLSTSYRVLEAYSRD